MSGAPERLGRGSESGEGDALVGWRAARGAALHARAGLRGRHPVPRRVALQRRGLPARAAAPKDADLRGCHRCAHHKTHRMCQ